MITAYNSALTALRAFGTRIQSNANNIANVNTDNYHKTRVLLNEADPNGVAAQVERVDTPGATVYREGNGGLELTQLSNVDLAEELPEMQVNARMYEANLKTLQTVSEMEGSLLDLKT